MTLFVTRLCIFYFIFCSQAHAQFVLRQLVELGDVKLNLLEYDETRKDWLLSDGFGVWETDRQFSKTDVLYNSYPAYQYALHRLPNGNIFSRQFDYTASIFSRNTNHKKIDSSVIFLSGNKQFAKINPASFVRVRKWASGTHAQFWAMNECTNWGEDSTVICRESGVLFARRMAGKDSSVVFNFKASITAFEVDKAGTVAMAGTQDSGWYFISENTDVPFQVKPLLAGNRIAQFYINDLQKQIWVQEESFAPRLVALRLYDYSSGLPVWKKDLTAEALGVESRPPLFAFDWNNNRLFVKAGLTQLFSYDLTRFQPEQNFFTEIQQAGVSAVDAMHFVQEESTLILAASRYDTKNNRSTQFMYSLAWDTTNRIPVLMVKNEQEKNQFYKPGLQTVTDKTIYTGLSYSPPSLSTNGLAIVPVNKSNYQLYDLPAGKVILPFTSLTASIENGYSQSGIPSLTPNGEYIFEIMAKPAMVYNLPDSFSMAMLNLQTGQIHKKIWIPEKDAFQHSGIFYWHKDKFPVFIQKNNNHPDSLFVETFYFDEQLNKHRLGKAVLYPNQGMILYDLFPVGDEGNFLYRSSNKQQRDAYDFHFYDQKTGADKILFTSKTNQVKFKASKQGFLLEEETATATLLHWYSLSGKQVRSAEIKADTYYVNSLSDLNPVAYLYNHQKYSIAKIELETGKITEPKIKTQPGLSFVVSPDEKYLLAANEQKMVWQMESDHIYKLSESSAHKNFIKQTQFTPGFLVSDGRVWNLSNGMLQESSLWTKSFISDSLFLSSSIPSDIVEQDGMDENFRTQYRFRPHVHNFLKQIPSKEKIQDWIYQYDRQILISKNVYTNQIQHIYALPFFNNNSTHLGIYPTPDKQNALIIKKGPEYSILTGDKAEPDSALILNLKTGKQSDVLTGVFATITSLENELSFFVQDPKTSEWSLYYTANDQIKKRTSTLKFGADFGGIGTIMNERQIARLDDSGLVIKNFISGDTKRIPFRYSSENYVESWYLYYDQKKNRFWVGYSDGGMLSIRDQKIEKITRPIESISQIIGKQNEHILVMDRKGDYHFINEHSLEADLHLYTSEGLSFTDRKYVWLTKENYYMASPGAENNIHFAEKLFLIPLKQADITYNRPDKVLAYLHAPQKNIELYSRLHTIREKKYSRLNVRQTAHVEISLLNKITEKSVLFQIEAKAQSPIRKIFFTVNGCPLTTTVLAPGKNINQEVSIPLNAGKNQIYCWVEDEAGNRSGMIERNILGEFPDEGKWYFLGIGVSVYKDSRNNLRYADKDIRDISKFLANKYPGIEIDTLLNASVTLENIREKMKKYADTNPDDKIIISISGHGLLDSAKQFWYANHDVDFNNPSLRGMSIEMLSGLFEQIPARYRLVTLDACHSGDVLDVSGLDSGQVRKVIDNPVDGIRGNELLGKKRSDRPSSELLTTMQLLFSDQLSHTGINLLAASSGTEFALEGNQWGNGVFTHVLLEGWAYAAREKSYNREIHYRNLKNYVQKRVSEITKGRQTPNTLMENGEIDWWLVK